MPYRPASHSPDPRAQFAGAQPLQPQQAPQQAPPSDPYQQSMHHRPQSTYDHPQELGTSVYDSPVGHNTMGGRPPYPPTGQAPPVSHQQFQQQHAQQPQDYSPSAYSGDDSTQLPSAPGMPQPQQSPNHFPPQPQNQAPYPNSPTVHQQAPSHQPPPIPGAGAPPSQYTAFNPAPSAPPGSGEYQAYQPPQGGVPASNPTSFYR